MYIYTSSTPYIYTDYAVFLIYIYNVLYNAIILVDYNIFYFYIFII